MSIYVTVKSVSSYITHIRKQVKSLQPITWQGVLYNVQLYTAPSSERCYVSLFSVTPTSAPNSAMLHPTFSSDFAMLPERLHQMLQWKLNFYVRLFSVTWTSASDVGMGANFRGWLPQLLHWWPKVLPKHTMLSKLISLTANGYPNFRVYLWICIVISTCFLWHFWSTSLCDN